MKKNFCLPCLFIVFLVGAPLYGQEELQSSEAAHHAAEEEHGSVLDVVIRWVNFVVLFGGLGYLLRKPALEFFETRVRSIQDGLSQAQEADEESGQKLADVDASLAKLADEVGQIYREAKALGDSERKRILSEGKASADSAIKQSKSEIERLTKGCEQNVRSHVASRIVVAAGEQLRSQIAEDAHGRIVRRVTDKI